MWFTSFPVAQCADMNDSAPLKLKSNIFYPVIFDCLLGFEQ